MNQISQYEHRFTEKRSTVTNLACKTQFLCENIDRHIHVNVVYMDMSKVFDQVYHQIFIYKLESQGSVLGPLFFEIYIDDLTKKLNVPYLFYTDDWKIYRHVCLH